jgi:NAD(P)H-hydrate epimerase
MPIPVISVAQTREWEKATWASGQSQDEVIRKAGASVARYAEKVTHKDDTIIVLAGKGHNGDDARLAASQIRDRKLKVLAINNPETSLDEITACLEKKPALIIDGLFGIGLNRSLSQPWIDLIRCVNRSGSPILAVDVPSGLNADSGLPLDEAIRATWTLTLGAAKEGLLKSTAWPFVGQLEFAPDIGLMDYPFSTECNVVSAQDFKDFKIRRDVASHKGSHGHLVIIAGSLGFHGAAVLAALGAQRAQPGLITIYTSGTVYVPVACQLQSVMVRPWSDSLQLPVTASAVLIGPGLASPEIPEHLEKNVRLLWQESNLPVILDASALHWVPPGWCKRDSIRVMTPHPGEAARMLKKASAGDIQSNRVHFLRELSRCWGGCRVVLKGHQTITGQQKEELFINNSGNPHLAQGGSGDLLAGYLAGLLAQPDYQQDPALSTRFAVWQHGAAADRLQSQQANWTIEDLSRVLGSVSPDNY